MQLLKEVRLFMIFMLGFAIYMLYIFATIQVLIPHRTQLHYTLIKIVLTFGILVYLKENFMYIFRIIGVVIIGVSMSYDAFVLKECYTMNKKWNQMIGFIEGQKALGKKNITLNKDYFISNYRNYGDFGIPHNNKKEWPNTIYAEFFKIDSLVVK